MRKVIVMFSIFGCFGSLLAADPTVGSWKLNVAESTFRLDEVALKQETMVVQEIGGRLVITQKGVGVDDVSQFYKWTHPIQGGEVIAEEDAAPSPGVSYYAMVIAPGDRYHVILHFGIQQELHHIEVSEDGRILTLSSSGIYPSGKPYRRLMLYERQ